MNPYVSERQKAVRAAEIFATLKRRILSWEYPPGYRFTEEDLCKEFGVSRSPVRETLRMLEEHNLVDKVPYRGCTVKQPDLNQISELYDVRVILETAVVELLASRGLPGEVAEHLHQTWSSMAKVTLTTSLDSAALADEDRRFHETLAQATGNRTLCELLHTINDRLHFIRMTDITTLDRLLETCRQHLLILESIQIGDGASAREAMRMNIDGARSHVHLAIKEMLAQAYLSQNTR